MRSGDIPKRSGSEWFGQHLDEIGKKKVHPRKYIPRLGGHADTRQNQVKIATELVFRAAKLEADNTGECVDVLKAGVWQVPPAKRPKGWERMGGKEQAE